MKLVELELEGLPPSVNQMYRNARVNTRYKTAKTRDFQEKTVALMKKNRVLPNVFTGSIFVNVIFYVSDNRKWDIDNRLKVLFDCLQLAEIIKDDSQIDFISAERFNNYEKTGAKTVIAVFGVEEKI